MLEPNFIDNLPIAFTLEGGRFDDFYLQKIKVFEIQVNESHPHIKISLMSSSGMREDFIIENNQALQIDARKYDLVRFVNSNHDKAEIHLKKRNSTD